MSQPALFFKSDVKGYVRSGGIYVKPHVTKVAPKPKPPPKVWHPKRDEKGQKVPLYDPHEPTDVTRFGRADEIATITPGSEVPYRYHGVAFAPWTDHPRTAQEWNRVEGQMPDLDEPPLPQVAKDKHLAAGVVIEEPDGRVWTVSPSNGFGGQPNVFPKGTIEDGITPQASAIKEAFEESGLKVEITGYLADVERSSSTTRYYRARRVGGDPSDAGWESQAVHLVPRAMLAEHLQSKYDGPLVEALTKGT